MQSEIPEHEKPLNITSIEVFSTTYLRPKLMSSWTGG